MGSFWSTNAGTGNWLYGSLLRVWQFQPIEGGTHPRRSYYGRVGLCLCECGALRPGFLRSLEWILDPSSAVAYRVGRETFRDSFPALRYQRFTVWGLTYRVLGNFFAALGTSLPSYHGG